MQREKIYAGESIVSGGMQVDLEQKGLGYFCKTYNVDSTGDYEVEMVHARDLLTPYRIDIIAKLKYVESHETGLNVEYATEIYRRNIEACTLGIFTEFGNNNKNSLEDFYSIFDALIFSIKANGFDENNSIIPVDKKGMILDGAHRVAVAAYFDILVPIIRFDIDSPPMDIGFFRKRFVPENDLDYLITEFCKWRSDLYLCCLWPSAEPVKLREKAIELLCNNAILLHQKTVQISYNGLMNLIPQIYIQNSWVGSLDDRFVTATPKIEGCYGSGNGLLDVILFQCNGLKKVKELKTAMRDIFGIAENSLHITDYAHETLYIAQMLFSDNTINFINNASPFKYTLMNKRIYSFLEFLQVNKLPIDEYIIDSSTVMGLYGIREPDDIDYLTVNNKLISIDDNYINDHKNEAIYYGHKIDNLLYDPQNHFYYFGIKIITLQVLLEFKKKRNTSKDHEDIKMIIDYIDNRHNFSSYMRKLVQSCKRKSRNVLFRILYKLPAGGYDRARAIYHFWKRIKVGIKE